MTAQLELWPIESYVALEERVKRSDLDALQARWLFGRHLFEERNGRKRLPNGRLQEICAACALSEAEVDNRIKFAEEYSEEKLPSALGSYGSWHEIEQRGLGNRQPHVSHNSGNNEWYTPAPYIEAARAVMGAIDLDPASTVEANKVVQAAQFFTREDDGLAQNWHGRVYMNPPYAAELIGPFMKKLTTHFDAGDIAEAVVLVNNATETEWFNLTARRASVVCFPTSRISFRSEDGKDGAPLQGQAVLYMGPQSALFAEEFRAFGLIFWADDGR